MSETRADAGDQKAPLRFRNPGFGRRNATPHSKGRQIDETAVTEIRNLLGDMPVQRDLLIEYLHLVQDQYGHLAARHLHALATIMNIPQAEIFEVATFYAHFDLVMEGEVAPPPVTVRVCDSLSCALNGAEDILRDAPAALGSDVRVLRAPCMGRCHQAPVAEVGHRHVTELTLPELVSAVQSDDHHPVMPAYQTFDEYVQTGGYNILKDCLAGKSQPLDIAKQVEDSGLRGLGGAGFKTGLKWALVRKEEGPRLMAVNGDEGEPGTIKDHHYLTREPHKFLEGMLIAAWVVEATDVYLYMRDEYPDVIALLKTEIAAVEKAGLSDHTRIHLRRGAGAYICGEESAMIGSIEGKRGLPRHRPPFVAQVGLFGRPTLVNNVETLHWIPEILKNGPDWFKGHGRNDRQGLRSFSVSGRVKEPGVKLAPAGITLDELIEEYCGGMEEGHVLKAYLPGGASGGILPASMANIPLDFDTLQPYGCFIGSAAIVIMSDKDDIPEAALNLMKFFEDESCGQCTPCRAGTEKAVKLMSEPQWDVALLEELSTTMLDASICGLGQAAPNPLISLFKYFPDDVPRKN